VKTGTLTINYRALRTRPSLI